MKKPNLSTAIWAIIVITTVLTTLQAHSLFAQVQMEVQGDGEVFMLAEVGAVIAKDSDKLVVILVMPSNMRPKGYDDVDIQKDDEILMVNGKKVKSVDDIQEIVDNLAPGDRLSFGLKRGRDMKITSFAKSDPKDLPKISMSKDSDPGGNADVDIDIGGDGNDLSMLKGSGLILTDTEDGITIAHIMPHAFDLVGKETMSKNDRIISLQSRSFKTAAEMSDFYESIKVGDKVTLVVSHDGKERTITFDKPEAESPGMMIITN